MDDEDRRRELQDAYLRAYSNQASSASPMHYRDPLGLMNAWPAPKVNEAERSLDTAPRIALPELHRAPSRWERLRAWLREFWQGLRDA